MIIFGSLPGPWLVGTTKVCSGVGADIVMESMSPAIRPGGDIADFANYDLIVKKESGIRHDENQIAVLDHTSRHGCCPDSFTGTHVWNCPAQCTIPQNPEKLF